MAQYCKQLDVPVAPETVFGYLADLVHAKDWDPAVLEAGREGDAVRLLLGFYGRRIVVRYRAEAASSERHLVFVAEEKQLTSRLEFVLAPGDDGHTELTYRATLALRGVMRLFDRGLQVAYENAGDKAVAGLATRLAELSPRG